MIQIRAGMPSASYQQHLKDQNATLLFDLVRRRSPISRAELTKASGLSAATVTVLVDELLQGGWLVELGAVGSTARGRRPINLAVNAARGAVATLEILSDGSILSVYDICLHKLTQTRSRLPASTSAPIIAQLRAQLAALGLAEEQLLGIHILYPGLIDTVTERLSFSAVIRSWQQCCPTILPDSRAAFPDAYVMLSNNAAAVAYSAFLRDTEPPPLPLLVMTVQEGIDAGTVLPGGRSMPLEAGHISIDRNGPVCNCGNRGCLETFCSTTALFARLRAAGIPVSMALTLMRRRSRSLRWPLHLATKQSQPACNAMAWIYAAQSCRWSTCWTCAPSGWAAFRIFWVSRSRSCCAAYSRRNFTS